MTTVGIIANPAAGKDIRRLVSAASSSSDQAKIGIVRRAIVGAIEGGAEQVVIAHDHKSFGHRAIHQLDDPAMATRVRVIGDRATPTSAHTRAMAGQLREQGARALVTLGGDGTHRDIVRGWRNAPLVPISTGTNNVFPATVEATIAGQAAAVAASGDVPISLIAHRAKILDVTVEAPGSGESNTVHVDLALVDVALVHGAFVASRAVWDVTTLRELIVTTAEPATIGLSAIAARLAPVSRREFGGVHVRFGAAGQGTTSVRAPIAPGRYETIPIAGFERLPLGRSVTLRGPGVLAFDGERDVVLAAQDTAVVTLAVDGPWVIDPTAALTS